MEKSNLFFLFALITVLFFRIAITILNYLGKEAHIFYRGYIVHHFWFGFIFLLIGWPIFARYKTLGIVLYGIGFGPIVDELIFMLIGGGGFSYYLAPASWIGAFAMTFVLFLFKTKIINFC